MTKLRTACHSFLGWHVFLWSISIDEACQQITNLIISYLITIIGLIHHL